MKNDLLYPNIFFFHHSNFYNLLLIIQFHRIFFQILANYKNFQKYNLEYLHNLSRYCNNELLHLFFQLLPLHLPFACKDNTLQHCYLLLLPYLHIFLKLLYSLPFQPSTQLLPYILLTFLAQVLSLHQLFPTPFSKNLIQYNKFPNLTKHDNFSLFQEILYNKNLLFYFFQLFGTKDP